MYWATIACNVVIPQALWLARVRRSAWVLFAISILVNVGMWMERVMLVVSSLHRDYLPSSWDVYLPSPVDVAILLGTLGFFGLLMLLSIRFVPIIPVHELQEMRHDEEAS